MAPQRTGTGVERGGRRGAATGAGGGAAPKGPPGSGGRVGAQAPEASREVERPRAGGSGVGDMRAEGKAPGTVAKADRGGGEREGSSKKGRRDLKDGGGGHAVHTQGRRA